MSVTYYLINSDLKLETALTTFKAIGVNAEFVDKGEDHKFYIVGNDEHGHTQMWVKDGLVVDFTQYGFGKKRTINMLFGCFNFIAYCSDDYDGGQFDHDLANLSPTEFMAIHYPETYKQYMNSVAIKTEFETIDHELSDYIKSIDRPLNSYRYEYAYVNNITVNEITDVQTIIDYIYQQSPISQED